jgi:hypothetical protein
MYAENITWRDAEGNLPKLVKLGEGPNPPLLGFKLLVIHGEWTEAAKFQEIVEIAEECGITFEVVQRPKPIPWPESLHRALFEDTEGLESDRAKGNYFELVLLIRLEDRHPQECDLEITLEVLSKIVGVISNSETLLREFHDAEALFGDLDELAAASREKVLSAAASREETDIFEGFDDFEALTPAERIVATAIVKRMRSEPNKLWHDSELTAGLSVPAAE